MAKYLSLFNEHDSYAEYIDDHSNMSLPNVSYCEKEKDVHYNTNYPGRDYTQDYMTTVALESGTISFNILMGMGTEYITSISYSKNNGATWTTTNNIDDKEDNLVINVNVNEGDIVLWKGNASQLGCLEMMVYFYQAGSFFSSTCDFNVQGNIMSLIYEDNFNDKTTIENDYEFCNLFTNPDFLMYGSAPTVCNIVSAKNLILPATTLTTHCYENMFYACTSLITAPSVLPATTLAQSCYEYMFQGCTSLTTAPTLPATTLTTDCYSHMFYGCTSLTTTPTLPATTLAIRCYGYMFSGCTSLNTAPSLPATTLTESCYRYMFDECTSLTTAPSLPATTLAEQCYYNMFRECTGLTTAPSTLPATTLAKSCYDSMFNGCTSLTTAPVLPATTLTTTCYQYMFMGCTSLNYIKCLATTNITTNNLKGWVQNVASSGTFVKASSMTFWTSGIDGVPSGWTLTTES